MFNNKSIPIIERGSGKPLIFLHGFGCSKEFFASQLNYFSRYYRVIAYDLYGFGKNVPATRAYNLADYVAEFNKVAIKYGERVSVVAHSFGCRVALKSMAESNVIEKAVLCGVAGLKPYFSFKKAIKRRVYRLAKPFFSKQKLEKAFFSSDYNSLDDVMKTTFKLVTNEYLDGSLRKIKAPTLVIFGENDDQTPPKLARRLTENISNCESYIMKNCGHFCYAERANEFNNVVREFLI